MLGNRLVPSWIASTEAIFTIGPPLEPSAKFLCGAQSGRAKKKETKITCSCSPGEVYNLQRQKE